MLVIATIIAAAIGLRLLARRGAHPVLDKELAPPGSDVISLAGKKLS